MGPDGSSSFESSIKGAVGSELEVVAFVRDYWQITFGHYTFSVFSRLRVAGSGWSVRDGDPGFRDRLCDCINHKIKQVLNEQTRIIFGLDNGCSIEISLSDGDYSGPEAINFRDPMTGFSYTI